MHILSQTAMQVFYCISHVEEKIFFERKEGFLHRQGSPSEAARIQVLQQSSKSASPPLCLEEEEDTEAITCNASLFQVGSETLSVCGLKLLVYMGP